VRAGGAGPGPPSGEEHALKTRIVIAVAALLAVAYLLFGAGVHGARAPRIAPPAGEVRGAWHVHTTRSDGLGTLDEVVRAAREAGLQFVVITDHNVLAPEDQGYRDGVLVVQGVEVSTRYGHVVAVGVPRALSAAERDDDPLGAIAALGGEAILAHPLHPRRPFSGWGTGPWRGFEIVSNDTSWSEVLRGQAWGKVVSAAALLPWDGPRGVLALSDDLSNERARFDDELRAARAAEPRRPARVLFCSADAHGYPSYRAAFGAFSMHVPVALTGDADADVRGVLAALLDGRASCVFDGVAPASSVTVAAARRAVELSLEAPDLSRARFVLYRDGRILGDAAPPARSGRAVVKFTCGPDGCGPGDYRVEGTWEGKPWIFTNPVTIE
jgi:hypothetical protein